MQALIGVSSEPAHHHIYLILLAKSGDGEMYFDPDQSQGVGKYILP